VDQVCRPFLDCKNTVLLRGEHSSPIQMGGIAFRSRCQTVRCV
jgi:hypothetical protein